MNVLAVLLLAVVEITGSIQITTEPGVVVTVDGSVRGLSTVEERGKYVDGLSAGNHEVRVEKLGFAPKVVTVLVRPGLTSEIKVLAFLTKEKAEALKSGDSWHLPNRKRKPRPDDGGQSLYDYWTSVLDEARPTGLSLTDKTILPREIRISGKATKVTQVADFILSIREIAGVSVDLLEVRSEGDGTTTFRLLVNAVR